MLLAVCELLELLLAFVSDHEEDDESDDDQKQNYANDDHCDQPIALRHFKLSVFGDVAEHSATREISAVIVNHADIADRVVAIVELAVERIAFGSDW